MRCATGRKAYLLKTWGIHAMHHGWTMDEVVAMFPSLKRKTVAEIIAWTKAHREAGWKKDAQIEITITGALPEQRPLSPKTVKRINAGIKKFFGKDLAAKFGEKTVQNLADRQNEQRRKMRALVRTMTDGEARDFIVKGHDYRRAWMIKHLDGQWGQTIEDMMKRMVGVKLGIVKNSR